jgi:hypothetical protein
MGTVTLSSTEVARRNTILVIFVVKLPAGQIADALQRLRRLEDERRSAIRKDQEGIEIVSVCRERASDGHLANENSFFKSNRRPEGACSSTHFSQLLLAGRFLPHHLEA